MSQREVVVLSGVRTAIGTYGGKLKDTPAVTLATEVTKAAIDRAGIQPDAVGHVVFGNIIHTDPQGPYLPRHAAVNAGVPIETPAMTVNRLCGSGLQAIVSASQHILLGDTDVALAGGCEAMSRAPYWNLTQRWGARMNDVTLVDALVATLHDPFDCCHMGMTAENIAEKWGITREEQDALAVESHRRAAAAIEAGYFKDQIVPIEVKVKRDRVPFDTDEHVRGDASLEGMAKLPTVFKKDGSVTPGNASGINDAAAALTLASREYAEKHGLKPLARLVGYAHAGVEPKYMGIGPVPAVKKVLEKTGLSIADMDVIELNEAFAAQAIAVIRDLGLPEDKTNPNGSGISLGHPVGATGCIVTLKAVHELARIGGRYALVTLCIGGGQGIAAVFERI